MPGESGRQLRSGPVAGEIPHLLGSLVGVATISSDSGLARVPEVLPGPVVCMSVVAVGVLKHGVLGLEDLAFHGGVLAQLRDGGPSSSSSSAIRKALVNMALATHCSGLDRIAGVAGALGHVGLALCSQRLLLRRLCQHSGNPN